MTIVDIVAISAIAICTASFIVSLWIISKQENKRITKRKNPKKKAKKKQKRKEDKESRAIFS